MNDNGIKEPKQINMSYSEMVSKFRAVERKGEHLPGYIVFTAESFGYRMMNGVEPTVCPVTTKHFNPTWAGIPSMDTVWTAQTLAFV